MPLSPISIKFAETLRSAILETQSNDYWVPTGRMFFIGNGGSAAVASHIVNDLVKLGFDAATLLEPAILTCLANDYSYQEVFNRQIFYRNIKESTLVAISSSGRSPNIINAVKTFSSTGGKVITFSGFDGDNPLRNLGHINYWVPSYNYGIVECAHLAILHSIANPG